MYASSIALAGISCRKKQRSNENFLNIRWTFFHSQSTSSRREDLMATDMGKGQETKIIWLTKWRRNAERKSSKESMTDSYEIMNSVSEWLNIIEMKKFVDDGIFLQTKITPIISQNKNTSTTRTNGGSIPISRVQAPYHWEIVLISSKRCLLWNDYNKMLEKNHTCLHFLTSTMTVGSEFIFYMVELARFLVVFLKFRKSRRT